MVGGFGNNDVEKEPFREKLISDYYLNIKTLESMDERYSDFFMELYNKFINSLLNSPDFDDKTRNYIKSHPYNQGLSHLYKTLIYYNVITEIRDLNIDSIID